MRWTMRCALRWTMRCALRCTMRCTMRCFNTKNWRISDAEADQRTDRGAKGSLRRVARQVDRDWAEHKPNHARGEGTFHRSRGALLQGGRLRTALASAVGVLSVRPRARGAYARLEARQPRQARPGGACRLRQGQ